MRHIILLTLGLLILPCISFGQNLEADLQFALENFPSIHSMKKERMWRDGNTVTYLFKTKKDIEYEYKRIYLHGENKFRFDYFIIEAENKRYWVSVGELGDTADFHIQTRSDSKSRWVKSKQIKLNKSKLSSDMKFVISATQGTLSSW